MERRNGGRSIPQFMNMQHLFLKFKITAFFEVKIRVQKFILIFLCNVWFAFFFCNHGLVQNGGGFVIIGFFCNK